MEIPVIRQVLESNEQGAEELRVLFRRHGVLVLNIISSPGSGKTCLLEQTLHDLGREFRMAVVEGDIQTDNDARRIAATGASAVQINTNGGCHLDSDLVTKAVAHLNVASLDILFIENVGNLVCPVEYDCGEDAVVAMLSVAEGDDKPEKYPSLFEKAQLLLVNKTDLLPYVDFSMETATRHARRLNPHLPVLPISCRKHEGLDAWYDWLRSGVQKKHASARA